MLFALHNVVKRYGAIQALNGLSVEVERGAVGLLGPNGAGKTTLIRTLLGLIRTDAGGGQVLGLDIRRHRLDIRQRVGFVPEDECLFPGTIGVEFVAFAAELCGLPSKDALQRAHEVLDYCGLGEARYRAVAGYSTGMKQRLKLAAAIAHDPELLILDEPTNGLDPQGREDVLQLARDLAYNKGMSLLFSSHLLPDVEAVCEYVIVLGRGKLLAQGKIAELKRPHDRIVEVRVKNDADRFVHALSAAGCRAVPRDDILLVDLPEGSSPQLLWKAAVQVETQIRHLRPLRSTLEEVFLRAVSGA